MSESDSESDELDGLEDEPRASLWMSMLVGGLTVLIMGGIGVVALILMALVRWNLLLLIAAVALAVVCFIAGAAGGAMYYATGPLRRYSTITFYLAAILIMEAYVFMALGLVILLRGLPPEDANDPMFYVFMAIVCAPIGVIGGFFVPKEARRL